MGARRDDFHYGWDGYAPQVDWVEIDTDHFSLFEEPAIDELADAIRSRLPDGS